MRYILCSIIGRKMKASNLIGIVLLLTISFSSPLVAQESILNPKPTRRIDGSVVELDYKLSQYLNQLRVIYKKSPRGILYGNPCAHRVTKNMGFEYAIEHRPDKSFVSAWFRFKNNFVTKTKLVFTKGPWWKATAKKRMKKCASRSGDRRG